MKATRPYELEEFGRLADRTQLLYGLHSPSNVPLSRCVTLEWREARYDMMAGNRYEVPGPCWLRHPLAVKFLWSFHDREHLFLVVGFHPGGDLATQLARAIGPASTPAKSLRASTVLT